MRTHNQSLDIWKGIAIICVVGIHVSHVAFDFPANSPNEWWGIFYRDVFDFSVALFMAISGFLSLTAAAIEQSGVAKYYKSRLSRLWPPYLIWTAIYLAAESPSSLLNVKNLAKAIFLGQGIGIGYFMIALTSLVILHPVLVKINRKVLIGSSALLSLLTVGAAYYARIEFPGSLFGRFPYYALPFTTWIVFLCDGIQSEGSQGQQEGLFPIWDLNRRGPAAVGGGICLSIQNNR
jgi:fucose 4-O-acetylase-like acetyltransferase